MLKPNAMGDAVAGSAQAHSPPTSATPRTTGDRVRPIVVAPGVTPRAASGMKASRLAWIAYNVVLFGVIVVSGAILFMVMVGMIQLKDKSTKDSWIEVNSQILNGCFTWMALTSHPLQFWRLVSVSRLLNAQADHDQRVQAAVFLSDRLPITYQGGIDTRPGRAQSMRVAKEPISFDVDEARHFRTSAIVLNGNCLFQYPIVVAMWAFNATDRPPLLVPVFLPLSFLCNIVGQYRLFQQHKRLHAGAHDDNVELATHARLSSASSPHIAV